MHARQPRIRPPAHMSLTPSRRPHQWRSPPPAGRATWRRRAPVVAWLWWCGGVVVGAARKAGARGVRVVTAGRAQAGGCLARRQRSVSCMQQAHDGKLAAHVWVHGCQGSATTKSARCTHARPVARVCGLQRAARCVAHARDTHLVRHFVRGVCASVLGCVPLQGNGWDAAGSARFMRMPATCGWAVPRTAGRHV
jgi:hypothetical protein